MVPAATPSGVVRRPGFLHNALKQTKDQQASKIPRLGDKLWLASHYLSETQNCLNRDSNTRTSLLAKKSIRHPCTTRSSERHPPCRRYSRLYPRLLRRTLPLWLPAKPVLARNS